MSKIKNCILNIKSNWTDEKTARTAKILSFFIGFFLNLLGIIIIAIWKYIFCNNEQKSKYCVRLAVLGWITETVICVKFLSFWLLKPFSSFEKDVKMNKIKAPIKIEKVYIDDFFEREIFEMNKMFERQQKMFNEFFGDIDDEIQMLEKEKKEDKNANIKEEIIDNGDGYKKTIIEKKTPNSYKKIMKSSYNKTNLDKNTKQKNKKK